MKFTYNYIFFLIVLHFLITDCAKDCFSVYKKVIPNQKVVERKNVDAYLESISSIVFSSYQQPNKVEWYWNAPNRHLMVVKTIVSKLKISVDACPYELLKSRTASQDIEFGVTRYKDQNSTTDSTFIHPREEL